MATPSPTGSISIAAGSGGTSYAGSGVSPTAVGLNQAYGIALDGAGDRAISDSGDSRVYFVPQASGTYFAQAMSAGRAYLIAGSGSSGGFANGVLGTSANLTGPYGLAFEDGNLLITDYTTERVWLLAGASGTFFGQSMTAGHIYSIVGTGSAAFSANGTAAASAAIAGPFGVAVDAAGDLYLALANSSIANAIRFIPSHSGSYYGQAMIAGDIYTIAGQQAAGYSGDGGPATSAKLLFPRSVTVDQAGDLYIADCYNGLVRFVPASSGSFWGQSMTADHIYTIAGNVSASSPGDGGPATAASLGYLGAVALDSQGNMVIPDAATNTIRFVPATSGQYWGQSMTADDIYTIAGTGTDGSSGAGGSPTLAELAAPWDVALDSAGDVFVTNYDSNLLEELTPPATAPAAPVQPAVAAGAVAGELTVTWTPPASDGGSPLTGYTVTVHDLAAGTLLGPLSAAPNATSATVTGLTPGDPYTADVRAINAVGASPSAASNTVAAPAAPAAQAPPSPAAVPPAAGAPTQTAAAPQASAHLVTTCRSLRHLTIHLPNLRPGSVRARLRGASLSVRTLRFGSYREAAIPVDLRGEPKGSYTVRIDGQHRGRRFAVAEQRTFRTCVSGH